MFRFADMPRLTVETISIGKSGNGPEFDDLPVPGNRKIKDVATDELRGILDKFGIEGSFVDGRAVIVARYAALVSSVYDRAGRVALDRFLLERELQCSTSE